MIGVQIGSYVIEEKLGEGGMGTVYRALEPSLARIVAIKVLNTDVSRDPAIVERFRSEARAQANLNHTNIATLYTLLVHEGSPVMVMEFVDGENFQQIIKNNGPLSVAAALPLFQQALLGIGAAHKVGLIHRDIKPSNLMLNRAGLVKVMDFGIAKVATTDRGLTRTGMQVGTVFYMSPEQVKGEPADARSDIYALGITLYQLLTGHVPFSADSDFQILTDHVQTPPPPPTSFCPDLPKGVEAIILKALEKDPRNRFQTVEAFGTALQRPELWEPHPSAPPAPLQRTVLETPSMPPALPADAGKAGDVPPSLPGIPKPLSDTRYSPGPPVVRKKPVPWKVFGAVAALLVVTGGAYLLFKGRAATESAQASTARANPHPAGAVYRASSSQEVNQLVPSSGADLRANSLSPTRVAGKSSASEPGGNATDSNDSPLPTPAPAPTPKTRAANAKSPGQATADQQPAPPVASAPPAVDQAELDEARHRFIRLRSRALALKSQLADLRQRLAGQGLSVRTDAIEAEGNLDSYMSEADRALQTGNLPSAQTYLDRAEHEEKLIASVVGG